MAATTKSGTTTPRGNVIVGTGDRARGLDHKALLSCRRCPRLRHYLKQLRDRYPDYWNQPVPASGPVDAPLQIIGLAPGLHGANRTGRPFEGDASGDLLWGTLVHLGIEQQVRISNVVKCLPRNNLPLATEVRRCQRFLIPELAAMPDSSVVLTLGGIAHKAVVRALDARQSEYPFGHGHSYRIGSRRIVSSYHCSRYNTQTGRLTETMFRDVVELAYQAATEHADDR